MTSASSSPPRIPLILLKTESHPTDPYSTFFNTFSSARYNPIFIPVLSHQHNTTTLTRLQTSIKDGAFTQSSTATTSFGGLIFTSQRSVEAFSSALSTLSLPPSTLSTLFPPQLPIYVVGPATARSLQPLHLPCQILGQEAGNGEELAKYILKDYKTRISETLGQAAGGGGGGGKEVDLDAQVPPLLFLVGDKRRDIIPTTLQPPSLPPSTRIPVHEWEIYETTALPTFASSFTTLYNSLLPTLTPSNPLVIVLFSPTGTSALLHSLGLLDEFTNGPDVSAVVKWKTERKMCLCAIGPTTEGYVRGEFGVEVDCTAGVPSPEGVGEAVEGWLERRRS